MHVMVTYKNLYDTVILIIMYRIEYRCFTAGNRAWGKKKCNSLKKSD